MPGVEEGFTLAEEGAVSEERAGLWLSGTKKSMVSLLRYVITVPLPP